MDLDKVHLEILQTQVRVKTSKAGGSGTILYSQKATYALTCHHVVGSAISVKSEWDPALGRERKKEYRALVTVEFFDWDNVPHGHRPVTYSADAEIVAYDRTHDMALLKLRTNRPVAAVARVLPATEVEKIRVGTPVLACGCALLHDPILTQGMITHMGDEIDNKLYWMSSAQIIFGNSGGSVFTLVGDHYYFVGIPSLLDVAGWGSPITHLGYFSPVTRVVEFLGEQLYHFLLPDSKHTEAECAGERKDRAEREERRLMMEGPVGEEKVTKGFGDSGGAE